jgi:tRNA A37 threonylcarbamoyladenosine modification protein TsaB
MHSKIEVLCITLTSPIHIGIYKDAKLIKSIISKEKSSDALPTLFKDIMSEYEIENIYYVNGPGSFMAIKVAYIFLKSISILKKIPLFATDAFYFNNNEPIKAIGKLHFVKVASEIKTQKLEIASESKFTLPSMLDYKEFSTTTTPLYMIGAVGQ